MFLKKNFFVFIVFSFFCIAAMGMEAVYSQELTQANELICTQEYDPVCGVDGRTYSNTCYLDNKGVNKAYDGECKKDEDILKIEDVASKLSENKISEILIEINTQRDTAFEEKTKTTHLNQLLIGVTPISDKMERAVNCFITYGVDNNTKKLGLGERAAVLYSYKSAFNKLPENQEELTDVVKIANGRWPQVTSEAAEKRAKDKFITIYKREPDMSDAKDAAAIKVMAYGLRQKARNRNLESEKVGIAIFKSIFGRVPSATSDWNAMQAITYSGASR